MDRTELTAAERELWHAWKRAGEAVLARVGRDIAAATGLSGADYGVVSRLDELGGGTLRQQALADAIGWDKSRLSHHLTRMEERGLVARAAAGGKVVNVELAREGRKRLAAARPVHAAAIRAHLVDKIGKNKLAAFAEILARLAA